MGGPISGGNHFSSAQKNDSCIPGSGVTREVAACRTSDSGSDGRQVDKPSLGPSRSGLFSLRVTELPMDRQMSDGLSPNLHFGKSFGAILFKPDGGDDGPSGLRRSITCPVRHVATQEFQISEYLPR
ncbi:hypothetical protein HAX54_001220, partial [Datura stramonium]|nr:hypothetical protein [Datura stramonium]